MPEPGQLARLVNNACEPFEAIDHARLGPMLERIGDARIVCIGEATHGTSEFYRMRARITRELIEKRGFDIVALEGDWPDVNAIDRQVSGREPSKTPEPPFSRFPTWMWRNEEVEHFVRWLRAHNERVGAASRVGVYGLDLYSLNASMHAVVDYLEHTDPAAAAEARDLYGCFSPWEDDPATYGRAASSGRMAGCEDEAVQVLTDLLDRRIAQASEDGEALFDAARNAALVRGAERYYRTIYQGPRQSWNLRDQHMFETLEAVLAHRGPEAKAVVWAHNSHLGDARATEMGARGEHNLGQLARQAYAAGAYLIGFGTDRGTVAAADAWNGPVRFKTLRPAHEHSYERICREAPPPAFTLPLRSPPERDLRDALLEPRLERAVGVIYRPETELASHYFQAILPAQFDEYIWFDETAAVTPLRAPAAHGPPETYPFGV